MCSRKIGVKCAYLMYNKTSEGGGELGFNIYLHTIAVPILIGNGFCMSFKKSIKNKVAIKNIQFLIVFCWKQ